MLLSIAVTLAIVGVLGGALRTRRNGSLIVSRPYNNRYNDAAGAREDHLA